MLKKLFFYERIRLKCELNALKFYMELYNGGDQEQFIKLIRKEINDLIKKGSKLTNTAA